LRRDCIPNTYTRCILYSFGQVSFGPVIITLNGNEKNGYKYKINKKGEKDVTSEMGPIFENYKKIIKELFENMRFNFFIKNIVDEINKGINLFTQTFITCAEPTFLFIPIT